MKKLLNLFARALYPYWKDRLTVLMYHRVKQIDGVQFDQYPPVVSANPEQFDHQMAFVHKYFNSISIDHLTSWLQDGGKLPVRPLLITFDDGYRDNFLTALPILEKYELPALFSIATDFIGTGRAFDWDMAAHCFKNTQAQGALLPITGWSTWKNEREKYCVMRHWVRSLTQQPHQQRSVAVENLAKALNVTLEDNTFQDLCLTWDQVRALTAAGMGISSHTRNHVVLDQIEPGHAKNELSESRDRIERETGLSVNTLAYPNGIFNPELEALVNEAGYDVAFSTQCGPSTLSTVAAHPLAIERVVISHKDNMMRFLAKLAGLPRLKQRVRKTG